MIWNTYELSASHLSRATAMFVIDCCKFGPSLGFGLKMEIMECADLVGDTTKRGCLVPGLILKNQYYWTCPKNLHHTSAVLQQFFLLIAVNKAQSWFVGWKWSFWPIPTWLAVQLSKAVLLIIWYDSINDMKHFQTVCITPQPCHNQCCCWLLPNWGKLCSRADNGA